MNVATLITRPCACKCGRTFTPAPNRPGQQYMYGHKPRGTAKPAPTPKPAEAPSDGARRILDYRLTLATLQRELKIVDGEIELVDDQLESCREESRKLQTIKDAAVERHGTLSQAADALQALIGNHPAAKEQA